MMCARRHRQNEIVGVGGPPITLPKVALEAHEMVVAHAWDSRGRPRGRFEKARVLYHNQTYKPVGEVKDLAFDAQGSVETRHLRGRRERRGREHRVARAVLPASQQLNEYVFAAALDGELALLKSAQDLAWTAPLPADRARLAASRDVVVVSTRLGSVVAFNHSGSERWAQKVGDGDDGGGTYVIIHNNICYAAGGGAWAAYAPDTGAPLVQGILKPRRCRGLGAAASTIIAAVEAGDSEDAPRGRGEMERTCALATLALPRRPAADASKLAKLEARFAVAADPLPRGRAARRRRRAPREARGAPRAAAGVWGGGAAEPAARARRRADAARVGAARGVVAVAACFCVRVFAGSPERRTTHGGEAPPDLVGTRRATGAARSALRSRRGAGRQRARGAEPRQSIGEGLPWCAARESPLAAPSLGGESRRSA